MTIFVLIISTILWFLVYRLTIILGHRRAKLFALWIANNAQPLAPNIGREWSIIERKEYSKEVKKRVTAEELYELFLKDLKK